MTFDLLMDGSSKFIQIKPTVCEVGEKEKVYINYSSNETANESNSGGLVQGRVGREFNYYW